MARSSSEGNSRQKVAKNDYIIIATTQDDGGNGIAILWTTRKNCHICAYATKA